MERLEISNEQAIEEVPTTQRHRVPQLQSYHQPELQKFGPEKTVSGAYRGDYQGMLLWFQMQGVQAVFSRKIKMDDDEVVALAFNDAKATDALRVVAQQISEGMQVIRRDTDVYVIGTPDQSDMDVRVYYVPTSDAQEYVSAFEAIGTDSAVVQTVGDVVVMRDVRTGLDRADTLYAALVGARGQYVVEVTFVSINEAGARELGIDWETVGELAIDVSAAMGTQNPISIATAFTDLQLSAMLRATESGRNVKLLTKSRIHCIQGQASEIQVGQTVPVPRRAVSESGTVQTVDYQEIDTGMLLSVTVTGEPDGRLRVQLKPELSSIEGFVEDAPILSRRRIETSGVIDPGGVMAVGGWSENITSINNDKGIPYLAGLPIPIASVEKKQASSSRLFILCRVVDPSLQKE